MIRYFSSHPTAANLLMVLFIALGVAALPELKRETFPEFASSRVQVRVIYPGASAEEVEEAIVQRLEEALNGIENVKEITAQAVEGVGSVILEMDEDAGDLKTFVDDIRTEVDAISSFPEDARDPVITPLARTDYVVSIAVTGPMSATDLKDYTESLKRKLMQLPEVSLVSVSGFSDRQIRIEISQENLLTYGLTIQTIASRIVEQNLNRPVGTVVTEDREISLRFKDQRREPAAYRNIILFGGKKGAEVKLGDIATIEERFEDDEIKTIFNNERAGILIVNKTRAQDSLVVVDAVKRFIAAEQLKAPPGVKLTKTRDLASVVRERLDLLITNGWQGLLLVFVSLWLFFSFRLSFWVTMGLPISFAGAIFLMNLIGYSFNMMTTVALIITLGLLMDDAIVIAENIASHLQKGKTALQASIDGVMEVQNGIISSFLTTACVFIPLAFLGGQMGRVLKVIPVVLLAVLAVSLVEAFLILPNHLSHSLAHHNLNDPGKFRRTFNGVMDWVREKPLGRTVDLAVRFRYLTVGIMIMLFVISLGTFRSGALKFVGFPKLDDDSIEVKLYMPPGTPLHQTEKTVARILAGLDKTDQHYTAMQPEKQPLIREIRVSYSENSDVTESGPHLATIYVDLLAGDKRVGRIEEILSYWRQQSGRIPDVISLTYDTPQRGPAGNAIEIEFRGEDLLELKSAANQV
ncbi:MAG: efflux RND transporter permease subunit, partial [bacterium]